ncbi:hypothetical protein bcgnr5372_45630 [Bacillus luti]|nr:hypothetical protein [Bacillus cereus]HDR8329655.1 hypothetical protein [Bacillus cereus]HDR8337037.1 hypothetical protein [Bacillus cereus]
MIQVTANTNTSDLEIVGLEEQEYELRINGREIGFAYLYVEETEIYIENVEISQNYTGYGYGRQFVEILKSLPNIERITGESVYTAIDFWIKFGAVFSQKEFDEYIDSTEEIEDNISPLVPFVIEI